MVMYLCSIRGIHAVITCIKKIKGLGTRLVYFQCPLEYVFFTLGAFLVV